jgi:hypothetical protein
VRLWLLSDKDWIASRVEELRQEQMPSQVVATGR